MSRDETHGGGSWGFTKCIWSPARKTNGTRWAFWETILNVVPDDLVYHLRGTGSNAQFVGCSFASSYGFLTEDSPPEPGAWSYAKRFYRANLKDFSTFHDPIPLSQVFDENEGELRKYFLYNKNHAQKKRLFYVIQAGRLQCLNGAYLSEIDEELASIIFGNIIQYQESSYGYEALKEINTGEKSYNTKTRIGQKAFSDAVKMNYKNICCFPRCTVSDPAFLIGGHIARWSDYEDIRGDIANGLCLCLMHDKAFEIGLFTIDSDLKIWTDMERVQKNDWAKTFILPFVGQTIRQGEIIPSQNALSKHWQRVKLFPH